MSDSDDDIPIALLMKKKAEAENAKKAQGASEQAPDKKRKSSGDESARKKEKSMIEKANSDKKEKKEEKKAPKKEEKKAPKKEEKKISSSNGSSQPKAEKKEKKAEKKEDKKVVSRDVGEENIFGLERMEKHNLVSAVLRRWNYCLDPWPGQLPPAPTHGYIEAHVPGVYVGASNIHLGQMKDLRPFVNGKTPSMASLLTYKTADLQQLLIKGINGQLALLGNSPEDEKLKTKLRHELEKAEKLKVKKYERKYREALQAIGKPLPEYTILEGSLAGQKTSKEDNDDNED